MVLTSAATSDFFHPPSCTRSYPHNGSIHRRAALQRPNEYWKIDVGKGHVLERGTKWLRDFLKSKGFPCKHARGLDRMKELYFRCQRGFISYEGLSAAELERFIVDRGLAAPRSKNVKKLKAQLEAADEEATFDRFSELPPELRNRIYKLHFAFLADRSVITNRQPPITVTPSIRQEALPLFYSQCHFTIVINTMSLRSLERIQFNKRCFAEGTGKFIEGIPAQDFARIRFLNIGICYGDSMDCDQKPSITFDLGDIKSSDSRAQFNFAERLWRHVDVSSVRARMVEIVNWADDIAACPAPNKLRKEDILTLHGILRAVYCNGPRGRLPWDQAL